MFNESSFDISIESKMSRRDFLKITGAFGASSAAAYYARFLTSEEGEFALNSQISDLPEGAESFTSSEESGVRTLESQNIETEQSIDAKSIQTEVPQDSYLARARENYEGFSWLPRWIPESVAVWAKEVETIAREYNVNPKLASCLITAESCGHPTIISGAGAVGLMQVMPQYHTQSGEDLTNPEINIQKGMSFLRSMYDRYGDWGTAVLAYNQGPGNTDSGIEKDEAVRLRSYVIGMYEDDNNGEGPAFQNWKAKGLSLYERAQIYHTVVKSNPLEFMERSTSTDFGEPHAPYQEYHTGWDIRAPLGTKYIAVCNGRVMWTEPFMLPLPKGHGYTVVLKSEPHNVYYVYAHAAKNSYVKKGDYVEAGTVIGESGGTGALSGPHLHFGVWAGGEFDETIAAALNRKAPFTSGNWEHPVFWLPPNQNYPPY